MARTRAPHITTEVTDADRVLAFEEHIQGQINPGPWQPVTDYSLGARRFAEGRHPALIREVFQPQRVLDFGCGPGCLVALLRELGLDATGFEPHFVENIERADPSVRPFLHPVWPADPTHDLVICREVLEHVPLRKGELLATIRRIVHCATKFIYVTTRYCQTPEHLLDVDLADNLDPTHVTLLNKELIRLLFVLHGCQSRHDLEQRMDWRGLGRCLVFERVH